MSVARAQTPRRSSRSAHLGARLRRVLTSPREGFSSAMTGTPERTADARLITFLVLLGGIAVFLVWLKLSALTFVERPREDSTWSTALPALVVGALAGAVAYFLWGRVAPRVAARLGNEATPARVKIAWSFASFPVAAYVAVFLPLDLLLVGPEIFSSTRLEGTLATVWAAASLAFLLSAAAWGAFLLWRGVEAAVGLHGRRVLSMVLLAVGCYLAAVALLLVPLVVLERFVG